MASPIQKVQKHRILELEQTLISALKEQNFQKALRAAETVLELEPGNVRANQFATLLREKLGLDESSSDSDDGNEGEAPGGHNNATPAQGTGDSDEGSESSSTGSSDDSQEEDDDDDDNDEEGDERDAGHTAGTKQEVRPPGKDQGAVQAGALSSVNGMEAMTQSLSQIQLDSRNSQLSMGQRRRIRRDLAASIAQVKAREIARQLKESDPLLG